MNTDSVVRPGEMSRQQVLDLFSWTDDDLAKARGFANFPAPRTRYTDRLGDIRMIQTWREDHVADWLALVKNLIRHLLEERS